MARGPDRLPFVENLGQWDGGVRFAARGPGGWLWAEQGGLWVELGNVPPPLPNLKEPLISPVIQHLTLVIFAVVR